MNDTCDDENNQVTSIFSSASYRLIEGKQAAGFPFVSNLRQQNEGALEAGADEGKGVQSVRTLKPHIKAHRVSNAGEITSKMGRVDHYHLHKCGACK